MWTMTPSSYYKSSVSLCQTNSSSRSQDLNLGFPTKATTIANLSCAIYHWLHQQALNDAISVLPGQPWLLTWLVQITKQQCATVWQIGKMNEWHMALHWSLCNISILIQASNPAPIITSLNTFTHDVDYFAMALYTINAWLTTLALNLHRLETAINIQEIWLQELWVLITRVEHTVVECMLLVEEHLPDHDDLIIICNLPSTLGQITLLTECTASEDLGYNILHCVNSLAYNLIWLAIPCPASAPAPGLAVLLLPPRVEFAPSHVQSELIECP